MKVYVVCYRKEETTMYEDTWEDMHETIANIVGVTTTKKGAVDLAIKFVVRELKRFYDYYGCDPDWCMAPGTGGVGYNDILNEWKYVSHINVVENGINHYTERLKWYVYVREFITAD